MTIPTFPMMLPVPDQASHENFQRLMDAVRRILEILSAEEDDETLTLLAI